MGEEKSRYLPPQTKEQLVLSWLRRARESQLAHYTMADILSKRGRMLGIPVIILSSVVGTSAFISIATELIPNWSKILVGVVSIAIAILSSLQTFFGYSDRAEKHRNSAARFGSVRRKFENIFASREGGISEENVEDLRQELDHLAQESLNVPTSVFKLVKNTTIKND